jgi:hypothetical protein
MLVIKIIGGSTDGTLRLLNNDPEAQRNEDVHWKVEDRSGFVEGIYDIKWKTEGSYPKNVNIFSANPPEPQGSDPVAKHWKGIVNKKKEKAPDYALFHYSIFWQDKNGGQHEFDPVISIKPSLDFTSYLAPTLAFVVGGIASLLYLYMKDLKEKKMRR